MFLKFNFIMNILQGKCKAINMGTYIVFTFPNPTATDDRPISAPFFTLGLVEDIRSCPRTRIRRFI